MGKLFTGVGLAVIVASTCTLVTTSGSLGGSDTSLKDHYRRFSPSVVSISANNPFGKSIKQGTGFYIDDGCKIATNFHVVKGAYKIEITNNNKKYFINSPYMLVYVQFDLAILFTEYCGNPIPIAENLPDTGERVFTIGNPRGLAKSISEGVVSGIRKNHTNDNRALIQTTTPISKGSSGGPLISFGGKAIGITTFYLADSPSINFAVPSAHLIRLLANSEKVRIDEFLVDRSSYESVATAFYWALHTKDIESAVLLVHPSDQNGFKVHFSSTAVPVIPSNAEIVFGPVRHDGKNLTTSASLKGTEIGIDLFQANGMWWVRK